MHLDCPFVPKMIQLAIALLALPACARSDSLPQRGSVSQPNDRDGDHSTSAPDAGTANAPQGGATADVDLGPAPVFRLQDAGVTVDAAPEPVGDAEACARSSAVAEPVPAVIQIVFDTSGSMRWVPGEERDPTEGERSKLEVTRQALISALDAMPDTAAAGLFVYPGREDDVQGDCLSDQSSTEIATLTNPHRSRLVSALSSTRAEGGTPTHDAYVAALAELEASRIAGDQYVVLITDGVPTYAADCIGTGLDAVSLDSLKTAAKEASDRGVRTFIVGSPGSDPARSDLSEVASLAGTARAGCSDSGPEYCHFDMTLASDFGASLQSALDEIGSQTLACSYAIPAPPDGEDLAPDRVNVRFTPSDADAGSEAILRAPSDTCDDGWQYSDDGARIVLCEPTCDRLRNRADSRIEVFFGCETQVASIR